jgi:methionyl-tRNA formyltransferase
VSGRLRLAFAGTPSFAAICLEALVAGGYRPVVVYAQPDRPAGRGRRLVPGAVKASALTLGLPLEQPSRLSDPEGLASLRAHAPDLLVVVAYGQILSPAVLAAPRLGAINVHASLLPRWRGAAPIERAILAGDDETGVSVMQVEPRLDAGPVFRTQCCSIGPATTAAELHETLAGLGASTLLETLDALASGTARAVAQDEAAATYAEKLCKAEARIDWARPCEEIDRRIRAFNPRPMALGRVGEEDLRIGRARPATDSEPLEPGVCRIEAGRLLIGTATCPIELLEAQAPGRRMLPVEEFLRGHGQALAGGAPA